MLPTSAIRSARNGALAVTGGASLWGLFWIPLRHLDAAGVEGLWSVALVTAAAALAALTLASVRSELADLARGEPWMIGAALGLSAVLYFAGVLLSDVVRVIFLFYLLPLWTTLAARLIYGEPIRSGQLLVIAAALVGLWLLLGGGMRIPLPGNIGDWCGLAAGLCWGVSLALLRGRGTASPFATTATALGIASVLATILAVSFGGKGSGTAVSLPVGEVLRDTLPLVMLFGAGVLYPALLGQVWGARLIAAPTAALLTMSEIVVATLSAWWLIGTELGAVSLVGGGIIVAAVILDISQRRRAARAEPGSAGR